MTIIKRICASVILLCVLAMVWLFSSGGDVIRKEGVTLTGGTEKTVTREEYILGAASYFLPCDCPEEAMKAVCVIVSTRLERGDATGFSPRSGTDIDGDTLKAAEECGALVLLDGKTPADTRGFDAQRLCALAAEGYTYIELLGHFFPGAVLTRAQ